MENQTETLAALETNPATLPAFPNPPKPKPESYEKRIKTMSDRALHSEVKRQGRIEYRRENYHGVILAAILNVVMDGHRAGKSLYPR